MAKAIVVSGASAGIGLALCQQLLVDHGCYVFLGARNPAKGEAALQSLGLSDDVTARCTILPLEVTSDESVQAAAAAVQATLGDTPLYALVNNAGAGLAHGVSEEQILETNLFSVKRVTDAFLPLLDKSEGRIVSVGSGAAGMYVGSLGQTDEARMLMKGDATWDEIEQYAREKGATVGGGPAGTYGLSKACVAAYTQFLAKANPEILSSCCSPGFIDTAMTSGFGASKGPAEGTPAIKKLLFDQLQGNGWYYSSDGERGPYHYMRNPGQPVYDGTMPF